VIKGIARGCEIAGCALTGGETAEHPQAFRPGEYDLAGFAVGVVEKTRVIDGRAIAPGDVLLGLSSSGPHSNGFSLIRRILAVSNADLLAPLPGAPDGPDLGACLLEPTRIYVKPVLSLLQSITVKGMAHITGGGLLENVHRMFPGNMVAAIDSSAWRRPPGVRLAATRRQCRRARNAAHVQLRDRMVSSSPRRMPIAPRRCSPPKARRFIASVSPRARRQRSADASRIAPMGSAR
jgi:phosphoribosylaminoimidazole synthetase